jgi:hypothetical protein
VQTFARHVTLLDGHADFSAFECWRRVMTEPGNRKRTLWWIAGADQKILAECPEADQIFIQHLGVSLTIAFFFVLFATGTAALVAFPDVGPLGTLVALIMALLVACSVFLIDRLFIQADWDWQARKQHDELVRTAWVEDHAAVEGGPLRQSRLRTGLGRLAVVGGRLALATAIGFTVASFLELVIYKNEINAEIHTLHYQENVDVYARIQARQNQIDADVASARAERDRQTAVVADVQTRLEKAQGTGPLTPSANRVAEIGTQIADIQQKLDAAAAESAQQQRQMVCEKYGTGLNPNCSGKSGQGNWYATAHDLKIQADNEVKAYQAQIAGLMSEREQAEGSMQKEAATASGSFNAQVANIRSELTMATATRNAAAQKYDELNAGRDKAVADYIGVLKSAPDFKPISFGMASQFRALAVLYTSYGIQLQKYMVKLLIMLIELTPVLQKLFLSPKTLYALKLDSDRKRRAYEHLEGAMAARRQHMASLEEESRMERGELHGVARLRRGDNVRDFAAS